MTLWKDILCLRSVISSISLTRELEGRIRDLGSEKMAMMSTMDEARGTIIQLQDELNLQQNTVGELAGLCINSLAEGLISICFLLDSNIQANYQRVLRQER
jgi:hypothetical protein